MALANTRANVKSGVINAWQIQTAIGTSTTWISLPYLRNGKFNIKTISTKTDKGINRPYMVRMEAEAEVLATNDLTGIIEVLDAMVAVEVDSQISLDTGEVADTQLIPVGTNLAGAGFEWEFVAATGNMDDSAYIKVRATRNMLFTQVPTLLGGSLGTVTASTSGFSAWATAIEDIVPGVITKAESGAGSYSDDHGIIRNGKFIAKCVVNDDQHGRNLASGRIAIDAEFEMMQASSTETALMDNLAIQDMDWRFTFKGGRVATLDSLLGFDYDFTAGGNREDVAVIKCMASGVVASSSWDGIWT